MAEEVDPIKKSSELISKTIPKVGETLIDADKTGTKLGSVPADATVSAQAAVQKEMTAKQGTKVPDVGKPPDLDDDVGQVEETTKVMQPTDMTGAIGEVSKEIEDITGVATTGEAATQALDEKATVKYQMANLMSDIEEGKPLPAWASPAVRKVQAVMQSRGMGASSMASAAMVQAVMESGMPIAAADAKAYGTIQIQNLTNQQAAALQKASTIAGMDTANLDARMTGAVNNAKNFLQMDLTNLSAEQAAKTLDYQSLLQGVFTDSAAENTKIQLNAKTETQVQEFYDELGTQVDAANQNRTAAMEQFNVSEENAMTQFQETTIDSREKFNANMGYAVDQSNVQWRRQINTANTTVQNETNRINTQMAYNASQQAMNFLWQKYRDNATFNFQKIENAFGREHAIGLMALEYSYNQQLLSQQEKKDLIKTIGGFVRSWNENN